MKNRKYNFGALLAQAKNHELDSKELKKIIKAAYEFGFNSVAAQFELQLVVPTSFGCDHAPAEVLERVAQGISFLTANGNRLTRTKQMLKRHGVIETINRVSSNSKVSKNLEQLFSAGHIDLAAEKIVLDFPNLFEPKAVRFAKEKLTKLGDHALLKA